MLARLADAVAALHTAGWVHGDLRPDNVLLETTTHHAFLLDLGEAAHCAGVRHSACGVRTDRADRADRSDPPDPQIEDGTPNTEDRTRNADARQLAVLLAWSLTGIDPAREPDRLSRSAGHPPALLQLWCEAREGRLPPRDMRDRLLRLARQLGLPEPARP
jgi:serine/threonine protein kinase